MPEQEQSFTPKNEAKPSTFEQKTQIVLSGILSGNLPTISTFPSANCPEMNLLGTSIMRIIYPQMIYRPGARDPRETNRLLDQQRQFTGRFIAAAKKTGAPVQWWRESGQTAFHFDNKPGNKTVKEEFAYYYNKTKNDWRPYQGNLKRAYLTIDPDRAIEMPEHFVGIVDFFRQSGVDFMAKAGSPYHAYTRTDDMVFYISPNDVGRARELFRDYIGNQDVFSGSVLAATPDETVSGLSWGEDPSFEEGERWKRLTKDPLGSSFSQALALRMAPKVFYSVASEYYKLGKDKEGVDFAALARQAQSK